MQGVKFALHRQVTVGDVTTFDENPMPGYEQLVTDEEGKIPKIDNTLPAGVYQLRESETIEGYEKLSGHVNFTISPTGSISLGECPTGVSLTAEGTDPVKYVLEIPNYQRKKVSFKKVDIAVTGKALAGARFDLYKVVGETKTVIYEGLLSGSDGLLKDTSGTAVFELPVGTYQLIETKAPDGYLIKADPVVINVSAQISYDDGTALSSDGTGISYDAENRIYSLLITNSSGTILPHTGGTGTAIFRIGGILLVGISLLAYRKRR